MQIIKSVGSEDRVESGNKPTDRRTNRSHCVSG